MSSQSVPQTAGMLDRTWTWFWRTSQPTSKGREEAEERSEAKITRIGPCRPQMAKPRYSRTLVWYGPEAADPFWPGDQRSGGRAVGVFSESDISGHEPRERAY